MSDLDGQLYGVTTAEVNRLAELHGIISAGLNSLHDTLVDLDGDAQQEAWADAAESLTAELEPFLAGRPADEPTEADPYPDGLPEDLYVDIESTIHQHCGHDGQSDEANDWVTDLMSAISPLIVRALVGGRPSAPTREQDEIERLRHNESAVILAGLLDGTDHATCDSCRSVMRQAHTLLVALLSRPAAEPPTPVAAAEMHHRVTGHGIAYTTSVSAACAECAWTWGGVAAEPNEEATDDG